MKSGSAKILFGKTAEVILESVSTNDVEKRKMKQIFAGKLKFTRQLFCQMCNNYWTKLNYFFKSSNLLKCMKKFLQKLRT